MLSSDSVTAWIAELKAGDASAAERLWERYFHRLVGLARHKLHVARPRGADEEDVALSAFQSFCAGATDGRFPLLCDRDNLWPLLVVLTSRKAQDLLKSERRLKRGGMPGSNGTRTTAAADLDVILSREPSPEFALQMAESCEVLLTRLSSEQRQIAELKLQGLSNPEIAARLDCGLRTIERRLELIRRIWEDAVEL